MGIYRDQVLPRVIDKALASGEVMKLRARCVEGLAGVLVEPGFGSGLNLPVYPADVTKVYAVDPATVGQKLAADRLAASPVQVEFVGLDGQALPLDDDSCDGAVLTFTLCTIPDAAQALAELRRVIRPGGPLHFLEHGHAPDASVQKWQRRLDPIQHRIADGCHLSRDIPALIAEAGFQVDEVDEFYVSGPKPMSYFYLGRATNPA